ncbi:MAG: BspA family leucine-rich repeat surface protein [Flavobacteriales bacterium]|nr:BspA family leucine-rich repeat surface protein [Flavobacteriales bacterium]
MKKLFTLFVLFGFVSILFAQKDSTHFVFTIQTDKAGQSNDSSYFINTYVNLTYNYDVDWDNDGVFDTIGITQNIVHQYDSIGRYTIRIRGTFPKIDFGRTNVGTIRDANKLISIDQWGTTAWLELFNAFSGCINLEDGPTDSPDLSMAPPIFGMFAGASKFNGDLSNWDVSSITSFSHIFLDATLFNQDLSNWNVTAAIDLNGMFWGATAFNQDIGNWQVDSVKRMNAMFKNATSFDQDISAWNVSSVTTMTNMFDGAISFNQDIGNWDISKTVSLIEMFKNAILFDQNLGGWDIDSVIQMWGMLDHSGLSIGNYDSTLIGWESNSYSNKTIGVAGLQYCAADSARILLMADGWSFNGDSLVNSCITSTTELSDPSRSLSVYPNPTNGILNIVVAEVSNQIISIYDSNARLLKEVQFKQEENQIDLSEYPNGLYFIHHGLQSKKVMLVH